MFAVRQYTLTNREAVVGLTVKETQGRYLKITTAPKIVLEIICDDGWKRQSIQDLQCLERQEIFYYSILV